MTRTTAVVLEQPERIALRPIALDAPGPASVVVDTLWSGVSTGTEKLFWTGRMPPFPGFGYPLVPGYESVGRVVEAPADSGLETGDTVFVPGAACFGDIRGLFGGAAAQLVTSPERVMRVEEALGADAALMALAATAYHALDPTRLPDLVVGHGALGRLTARLILALGGEPPVVWETNPGRRDGAEGYRVVSPAADERRDYRVILDASGDAAGLDRLVQRLAPGGEIVLAGFYAEPLSIAYPPAFMREARLRIAAEWTRTDLAVVGALVGEGRLSLGGIVTHRAPARAAAEAYPTAFDDPHCLKLILDWRDA